jgi:hypothetical protein
VPGLFRPHYKYHGRGKERHYGHGRRGLSEPFFLKDPVAHVKQGRKQIENKRERKKEE